MENRKTETPEKAGYQTKMKRIPQNALTPLAELCNLLSSLSDTEEQPISFFKRIIQGMDEHANYFFDKPWPQRYQFNEATSLSETDLNFTQNFGRDEFTNNLYLLCVKKNMNLADGFSLFGFFWTLWTINETLDENYDEKPVKIRTDPALFARALANWNPFPYQERLLSDTSKRIVSCWGRQCGKTSTVAIKAVHYAYCNPNVTVLVASPSLRQSMIMFDRILGYIEGNFILNQALAKKTRTVIQLLNGSRIVALPCSENLLRGYSANLVICDEAAFMPEEAIVQVIFPMLSVTDGSAIFLSTPWGKDHFFHKAYTDPNYSVHHVKSTECPPIKPEFLEEQKRNMTEEAYRSEYLAEFSESANSFFSQDLIRNCIDNELELITDLEKPIPHAEYYAGTDFGKLNDHSATAIIKRQNTDQLKLVYLHEFPLNTQYTNVIGHLVTANQKFHTFEKVTVDQTGVGELVLEELKNQDIQNIEGLTFTVQTKENILTSLKLAMEQKRLRIPYHRRLCEQINQQQYQYSKTGHLTFSHPRGSHDDLLWALTLATWTAAKEQTPTLTIIH